MAEEKADRDDPRTSERKYVPFPITPPNAKWIKHRETLVPTKG